MKGGILISTDGIDADTTSDQDFDKIFNNLYFAWIANEFISEDLFRILTFDTFISITISGSQVKRSMFSIVFNIEYSTRSD